MHKVLRTFTDGIGRVYLGQIVDGSKYRNLGFLMRQGYLVSVEGDVKPSPREIPAKAAPAEATLPPTDEADVDIATDEAADEQTEKTEEAPSAPATVPVTTGNILDQVASAPVTAPKKETQPAKPPAKKKH